MIKAVEKFIEEFHGWSFPIDLKVICKNLKIKTELTNLPNYMKGYFNKELRCIYLNINLNHNSQRFITARELRQASLPYLKSQIEKNFFAQELLMPTNEFIRIWNKSFPTQLKECCWYFDVSFDSAVMKAKKLYEKGLLVDYTYNLFSNIFNDLKRIEK